MKKLFSVLLTVCMTVALLLPCFVIPAGAAINAPHPGKIVYDYSDWDDHCMLLGDKWSLLSTGVVGINGNPALTVMPLKQNVTNKQPSFSWNHFAMPFVFEDNKTYVVSFDVTLLSQVGKDAPDSGAASTWYCCSTASNFIAGGGGVSAGSNNDWQRIPVANADGSDLVVTAKYGEWSHFTGTVTKNDSNSWKTNDCLFFWENQIDGSTAASQIAIDNMVIMEQTEYSVSYPEGVPARTDVPAVDMIASNFNSNRYVPFLDAAAPTSANVAVNIDGDGRLKWNCKKETNAYTQFAFQKGKTYHLSFDAMLDNGAVKNYPDGATLEMVAADSRTGANAEGAEAFAGNAKINATEWTHLELTLTPQQAHSFFAMTVEKDKAAVVWFDNFRLYADGSEPACNMGTRSGADNPADFRILSDFEDERGLFYSGNWYWNSRNELVTLENGNHVQKITMSAWAKNFAYMTFAKNKTYVIGFDVYGVSAGEGATFSLYAKQFGSTLFDDPKGAQFAYANEDGTLNGNFKIVPNAWTHYNVTLSVGDTSNLTYLMLLMGDVKGDMAFYLDNLTVMEKTGDCATDGHTAGLWVSDVIATCANEGHSDLICAVCGAKMEEKTLPKTHVKGDRIVTKEPTCTEKGSFKYECVSCHEVLETGEIDALGHTSGEWTAVTEADCHKEGSEEVKCTVCGAVLSTRAIPKLQHIEGKWVIDKEAAPGVKGHRHKTCTLCGDTLREEDIDALPAESESETRTDPPAASGTGSAEPEPLAGCESAFGGIAVLLGTMAAAGVLLGRKRRH